MSRAVLSLAVILLVGCAGTEEEIEYGDKEETPQPRAYAPPAERPFVDCPGAFVHGGAGDFEFSFEPYNEEQARADLEAQPEAFESEVQTLQALEVSYVLNEESLAHFAPVLIGGSLPECSSAGQSVEGCTLLSNVQCLRQTEGGELTVKLDVGLKWQQKQPGFQGSVRMDAGNGISTYFRFKADAID
jgi:hypothetical protein